MDPTQKQNDVLGNQPSVNGPSGVGYPPVAGSQPVVSDGPSVGNSPVPDTRPLMVNQSLVGDSPTVSSQSPMGVSNTGGLMDAGGANGPVGVGISNQPMNAGQFGGLNNMGNQSVPMSTGTGDIILAPEKKSKKWWIVGAVGVTICAVAFFLFFFINQRRNVGEVKEAWSDYYNYLMYGDNEKIEDVSINNWYPTVISEADAWVEESGGEGRGYYDVLDEKYERLYGLFSSKDEEMKRYNDIYRSFFDYNQLSRIKQAIVDEYYNNDIDAANRYIESIGAEVVSDDENVTDLYYSIRFYLEIFLSVVDYYNANDCNFIDASVMVCPKIDANDDTEKKLQGLYMSKSRLDYYYDSVFLYYMFYNTLSMNQRIEGGDL